MDAYCGGVRSWMSRSRHILGQRIPVAIAQGQTHEAGAGRPDRCMGSELMCPSGGADFVGLGFCLLLLKVH